MKTIHEINGNPRFPKGIKSLNVWWEKLKDVTQKLTGRGASQDKKISRIRSNKLDWWWTSPHFFKFSFQEVRLSCNLLKWSWTILLQAFWWADFLSFSVVVPDQLLFHVCTIIRHLMFLRQYGLKRKIGCLMYFVAHGPLLFQALPISS